MPIEIFYTIKHWLPYVWWPFCRLSAALLISPFTGDGMVPVRVRLGMALAIALACTPALQDSIIIDPFSLNGVATTFVELSHGLIFGMALKLMMSILSVLGFLLSSQMGLSMAVMNDPASGESSDVISTMLYVLGTMIFFSMDGHLVLIQIIYASFHAWPVGTGLLTFNLLKIAETLAWTFSAALLLAIPAIFSTFILQMGIGLINRIAPALNLYSLGFPLVTLFGFTCVTMVLRWIPAPYLRLCEQVFSMLNNLLLGSGHGA